MYRAVPLTAAAASFSSVLHCKILPEVVYCNQNFWFERKVLSGFLRNKSQVKPVICTGTDLKEK